MKNRAIATMFGVLLPIAYTLDRVGWVGQKAADGAAIVFKDIHDVGVSLEGVTNAKMVKAGGKAVLVKTPRFVYRKIIK